MRLLSYKYRDPSDKGWNFQELHFRSLNLIVGDTGSGKTRILNTICNLSEAITNGEVKNGNWKIKLEAQGSIYLWNCTTITSESNKALVETEYLYKQVEGEDVCIVERSADRFVFNGNILPKLSRDQYSISILSEEDDVLPVAEGFSKILRRSFQGKDLIEACAPIVLKPKTEQSLISHKSLDELFKTTARKPANVNAILYVLSKNFPKLFQEIKEFYMSVFPFVTHFEISSLEDHLAGDSFLPGTGPVLTVKEKGVASWLPLHELSSGMQKVLLILTDVIGSPDDIVYIIDEYENSLGVGAINFFPSFLSTLKEKKQFIITSHHPYIINEVPPDHWIVFCRDGSNVKIRQGDVIAEQYGKSKQASFIKLINDPFFNRALQ